MPIEITCFKAYDVRGQIPNELNADVAFRIANASAEYLSAKTAVIGRDIRLSSPEFAEAVRNGLTSAGVKVLDIGLCGTEMVYHATSETRADLGIMVTASHNPADYNGLKIVREDAKPVSGDSGLEVIRKLAEADQRISRPGGRHIEHEAMRSYVDHLLTYVDVSSLNPLKIVANPGNGGAGIVMEQLERRLPFRIHRLNFDPDGRFPNGIPNPMLIENQEVTSIEVVAQSADMGIAWDGDFDRCFFFDETGTFIDGYYIVGLLAESILAGRRNGRIVYDPRMTWNTIEIVEDAGGEPVQSKSGHSFIKEKMRDVDAVYGGEMSAHHYFRNFSYADSGMIPWLLVAQLVSTSGKSLGELVRDRMARYPASGEINRKVEDATATLEKMRSEYSDSANRVDNTDGYSFEFDEWRFNIRMSNTEPVVRLNVETRGDKALLREKTEEVLALMEAAG